MNSYRNEHYGENRCDVTEKNISTEKKIRSMLEKYNKTPIFIPIVMGASVHAPRQKNIT